MCCNDVLCPPFALWEETNRIAIRRINKCLVQPLTSEHIKKLVFCYIIKITIYLFTFLFVFCIIFLGNKYNWIRVLRGQKISSDAQKLNLRNNEETLILGDSLYVKEDNRSSRLNLAFKPGISIFLSFLTCYWISYPVWLSIYILLIISFFIFPALTMIGSIYNKAWTDIINITSLFRPNSKAGFDHSPSLKAHLSSCTNYTEV